MNENNAARILHKVLTSPRLVAFTALILIAGASNLGATTVGPTTTVSLVAVAETTIFAPYPDNNFGTSLMETGSNGVGQPGRGLIQWNLTSIPSNAIITDASITMQVIKVPPGDQHAGPSDSNFGLYAMLVPWVAGTGSTNEGTPATLGETTWDARLAGIASWGTPGGQIGTDFANSASTSAYIQTNLGVYTWGSTPQMLSDLQSWLTNPSANYGYMMMSDAEDTAGTARRFDTIYSADATDIAPTLTVTFTVPAPEPSTGILLLASAFCFMGRANRRRVAR